MARTLGGMLPEAEGRGKHVAPVSTNSLAFKVQPNYIYPGRRNYAANKLQNHIAIYFPFYRYVDSRGRPGRAGAGMERACEDIGTMFLGI